MLGVLWPIASPLAQLFTFAFVFVHIFKARVEGLEVSYIVWLALGMWPWFGVQEGVGRAASMMVEGADLSSKIAIDRSQQVLSSCLVSMATHGVGFLVVLLYFFATGTNLHWAWTPLVLLLWVPIFVLSYAASLLAATMQVFIKDMVHGLPLLLTLWFFSTPIFYAAEMFPEAFRNILFINPMTGYVALTRDMLIEGTASWHDFWTALAGTAVFAVVAWFVYRRCEKSIEEFL